VEEVVFHDPKVAAILRERYVEARLHTDKLDDPARTERIVELQRKLTGVRTLPVYLIEDPKTGRMLGRLDGYHAADAFITFLQQNQ
jgi:hypothetical protein